MAMTGVEYIERYPEWRQGLPGKGQAWLAALREEALRLFGEHGFPTRKVEAWKYTNLAPLAKDVFAPKAAAGKTPAADLPEPFGDLPGHRMVFVNGQFAIERQAEKELPKGIRVLPLSEAFCRHPELVKAHLARAGTPEVTALLEMNTALMAEGTVLVIEAGTALEAPLHLVFLATEAAANAGLHLRNLIILGKGCRANVIESYVGKTKASYWTNAVTEIVLAEGAHLRHYKVQEEGEAAYHTALTLARLADRTVYENFALSLGAELARNEIQVLLDGSGIDCRLNGVHLARRRQHLDTTTVIDHLKPGSRSNEIYKSVVDGRAESVFQGKIVVQPDAQKTAAHQLSRALLLSDTAQVNAKPELRIHADDVQCSHGTSVSELDALALFYLRSRGISERTARSLLTEAFVTEQIEEIGVAPVRELLHRMMANWLANPGQTSGHP